MAQVETQLAYFREYRQTHKADVSSANKRWYDKSGKAHYYDFHELTKAVKRKHYYKSVGQLEKMAVEEELIKSLRSQTPKKRAGVKRRFTDAESKKRRDVTIRKVRYKHVTNLPLGERPQFCEVCGGDYRISLDHCHTTNTFRGWLCDNCNVALGRLNDDPVVLRRLADYVEQHRKGLKALPLSA